MLQVCVSGELAQMVERPLRMREVPGSIPGFSSFLIFNIKQFAFNVRQNEATQKISTVLIFAYLPCAYISLSRGLIIRVGFGGIFLSNNSRITSSVVCCLYV